MIEYAVLLHLKRNSEHKDRQQSDQTNGTARSPVVSKRLLSMNNDGDNKSYEDSNMELSFLKIRNKREEEGENRRVHIYTVTL